jgi:protocatechuate 3,4-dioxygenase beta subunit
MRNDRPAHPWSRRRALSLLGFGGAWISYSAAVRGQSAGAPCVVRPTQTEGPYFVDGQLHRSDIRSDPANGAISAGTPLALTMLVSRLDEGGCRPLPNAIVDLWHCDAQGIYSGVQDPMFDTAGTKFLRGFQRTDADGRARFVTIYPGGYRGRTVHIHFKIRTEQTRGYEFTSQLYFDDALTARVHSAAPYAERKSRLTRNQDDRIFRRNGADLMLAPVSGGDGYSASFPIALDLS